MGDMADWIIEQGEISDAIGEVTSEPLTCDKCGRPLEPDEGWPWFSQGIPYLLCPECAERKDREDL